MGAPRNHHRVFLGGLALAALTFGAWGDGGLGTPTDVGRKPGATADDEAQRLTSDALAAWQQALEQRRRVGAASLPPSRLIEAITPPAAAVGAEAAPAPFEVLDSLEAELRSWQAKLGAMAEWDAQRPPPAGRAQELVALAEAAAVERRHCRVLRGDLARWRALFSRWRAADEARTARDLERLRLILAAPDSGNDIQEDLACLAAWRDELAGESPPAAAAGGTTPESPNRHALFSPWPDSVPDSPSGAVQLAAIEAELDAVPTEPQDRSAVDDEPGAAGMGGRTERLQRDAQAHPAERQRRVEMQTRMQSLARLLQTWIQTERNRADDDLRRLERILALARLKATPAPLADPSAQARAPDAPPETYEYYELPNPQSLREISAMPTTYGDAAKWTALAEANPGIANEPDQKLPKGTLLVIPRTVPAKL